MTKPIPEYFLPAEEHLSWEIPTPVGRLEIERRDGVWSYVAIDDDDEDEDEDADNAPDLIMIHLTGDEAEELAKENDLRFSDGRKVWEDAGRSSQNGP